MSRSTARVLTLLELLQSGGQRTVGELAERLRVDERTVRRYVAHLVELDIPAHTVRGRYGGYQLARGYRLPPLMLTENEAVAVAYGLIAAGHTSTGQTAGVVSATAKLRRVLPRELGRRLELLLTDLPDGGTDTAVETRTLLHLAASAGDRSTVAFDYTDHAGHERRRVVSPYGVVRRSNRWYLVGRDEDRSQLRNFRLDRIANAEASSHRYVPAPADLDPAAEVATGLAATPWRFEVVVRLDRPDAPEGEILGRFPPGATATRVGDGVRITFRAEQLHWVPAMLLGLDVRFAIEAPEELISLTRIFAQRLGAAVD